MPTQTTTDKRIVLTERVDAAKLRYIVRNFDTVFKQRMRWREDRYKEGSDTAPRTLCNRYLARVSEGGVLRVEYFQRGGSGRFYARESVGLQGMAREIRQTVCRDYYDDLDIVNAHVAILAHLCDDEDGLDTAALRAYCDEPEKHRAALMEAADIDRDTAK